jgi:DMSO reductase anchor subunit
MNVMSIPFFQNYLTSLVYYIVYVMQGAGVSSVLLISSIQYVINVVMTVPAIIVLHLSLTGSDTSVVHRSLGSSTNTYRRSGVDVFLVVLGRWFDGALWAR